MRTETASYTSQRTSYITQPQAFVRWFFVRKRLDATEYAFTRDFATKAVLTPTADKLLCIRRVTGHGQEADPIEGRSSIGTLSVELVNLNKEITRYLADPAQALQVSLAATGTSASIAVTNAAAYPGKGTVTIDSEDLSYTGLDLVNNLLTGVTRAARGTAQAAHALNALVHNGEQLRPGTRCTLFLGYAPLAEADYGPGPGFAKLEVGSITSGDSGLTWIVRASDVQRFARKKVFQSATQEAPTVLATGHPLTIALQVLTSTGTGTNGIYDVLAAENGAGVPQALIDVAGLTTLRDTDPDYAGLQMQFNEIDATDAKTFVEEQIFRPLNLVPFITQSGQYGAKKVTWVSSVATIADADILADPRTGLPMHQWTVGATIRNRVDLFYDFNLAGLRPTDFGRRQVYTADTGPGNSKDTYGLQPSVVVKARGVQTSLGGQALMDTFAKGFLNQWAYPPPVLRLETTYRQASLELMDSIQVTHALIAHPVTGVLGLVNERFKILRIQPAFEVEGKVLLDLLWAGSTVTYPAPSSAGAVSLAASTPTGLVVTTNGSDVFPGGPLLPFVQVSWTAVADADVAHYEVRWRIQGTAAYASMVIGADQTTAKIEGLKAATIYEIQVRSASAKNAVSPWSTAITVTTVQDLPPAVPAGLTLTISSEVAGDGTFTGVIDAAWTANTEADLAGYVIQWRQTGTIPFTTQRLDKTARLIIRGLKPATSYDVAVAAFDGASNTSAFSAVVAGTTPANPGAPAVPTGLATVSLPLAVAISWAANPEADIGEYQLERANDAAFTLGVTTLQKGRQTAYLDETADTTTRYYHVKAIRRSGAASAFSAAVTGAGVAVGDANLASLSVTKLLAGNLSVAIALVVGGILQSATSGARVEIDNAGVRIYDAGGQTADLHADGTFTLGPLAGARVVITKNTMEVFDATATSVLKIQNVSPYIRIGKDDGTALKVDSTLSLVPLITAQLGSEAAAAPRTAKLSADFTTALVLGKQDVTGLSVTLPAGTSGLYTDVKLDITIDNSNYSVVSHFNIYILQGATIIFTRSFTGGGGSITIPQQLWETLDTSAVDSRTFKVQIERVDDTGGVLAVKAGSQLAAVVTKR